MQLMTLRSTDCQTGNGAEDLVKIHILIIPSAVYGTGGGYSLTVMKLNDSSRLLASKWILLISFFFSSFFFQSNF